MISLTPEILRAAYDFLCATPPFDKWNLPDSDDLKFAVTRSKVYFGKYYSAGNERGIEISAHKHGHTQSLLMTMAHEMIHLHQDDTGMDSRKTIHNAAFLKLAARVCKIHGWDARIF